MQLKKKKCVRNTVLKLVLLFLEYNIVRTWIINPSQMPILDPTLLIRFNKYSLKICYEQDTG